jgi:hypothetical protein
MSTFNYVEQKLLMDSYTWIVCTMLREQYVGTWIEAFSLWLVMWLLIVCGVAWLLLGLGLCGRKIYSVGVLWLGFCGSGVMWQKYILLFLPGAGVLWLVYILFVSGVGVLWLVWLWLGC